jgi:hypothetical protein
MRRPTRVKARPNPTETTVTAQTIPCVMAALVCSEISGSVSSTSTLKPGMACATKYNTSATLTPMPRRLLANSQRESRARGAMAGASCSAMRAQTAALNRASSRGMGICFASA